MIKILHVLHQSSPNISGSSTRTNLILKWTAKSGIENVAITTPFQESFDADCATKAEMLPDSGTKVYRTQLISGLSVGGRSSIVQKIKKICSLPYFFYRLLDVAKKERPDIIHAHSTFICAIPAIISGKLIGCPVIYEVRSLWFENSNFSAAPLIRRAAAFLEAKSIAHADHVIVISKGLFEFAKKYKRDERRITVVMNAIDDEWIDNSGEGEFSRFKNDPPIFGYVGSVIDIEGLEYVIRAFEILKFAGKSVVFNVYGDGSQREYLQQYAMRTGADVVFHGKFPHSEVENIYRGIDVVINYRKSNTVSENVTPLKPLEALLYQKLLVCADVGGYREILDGDHAVYVKPDSPEALAEALLPIVGKVDFSVQVNSAYEFVIGKRLWSANSLAYKAVYSSLKRVH